MKPIGLEMNDPLTLGMGHPTKERIKRLTLRRTNKLMRYGTASLVLAVVVATTPILSTSAESVLPAAQVQTSIDFDLTQGPPTVSVEIEGTPYKLLVDPSLGASIFLNSSVVEKLKLKESRLSSTIKIDGNKHYVKTRNIDLKINEGEYEKRRVFWTEQETWSGFDGTISGASLGFERVSFSMPAKPGKKYSAQTFKTFSTDLWAFPVNMHDDLPKNITVVFTPHIKFSRADLVMTHMLKRHNFFQDENKTILDAERPFGVQRHVAKVEFQKPLNLLGKTLQSGHVQVHSPTLELESIDKNEDDEVVVTDTLKGESSPAFLLSLDALGDCIKVEFVRRKAHIHCEVTP